MSETTGFWSKVRGYLKYRPASSASRGWVKAGKVLIPVAIIFVLFRIGIPPLHVIPIWGPSMQPTMQVWSLPEPWEKWSFSGWVHYDPEKKPEVGSIVYFRVPNTKLREVKRVSEINDLGLLYVLPDNTGVSGEGSDNSDLYEWLCAESVIGVVDAIWTPTRAIRWLTAEGRFRNMLEDLYPPSMLENHGNITVVAAKGNRYYYTKTKLVHVVQNEHLLKQEAHAGCVVLTQFVGVKFPLSSPFVRCDGIYQQELTSHGNAMGVVQIVKSCPEYQAGMTVWCPASSEQDSGFFPIREVSETEQGTKLRLGPSSSGREFRSQKPPLTIFLLKNGNEGGEVREPKPQKVEIIRLPSNGGSF